MKLLNKFTFVILGLICLLFNGNVHSQTLKGKTLKTNEASFYHDESFYQWFEYWYYTDDGSSKYAAFDQNGRRITPTVQSVIYKGGGIFEVYSGKLTSEGKPICSLYNTKGSIIMSEDIWVMSGFETSNHVGGGILELTKDIDKNECAIYNIKGQCFASAKVNLEISIKKEEDFCYISAENWVNKTSTIYDFSGKKILSDIGLWSLRFEDGLWSYKKDGKYYLCSKDFKYVAETVVRDEFDAKKRINPDYNGPYNFRPIPTSIDSPTHDSPTNNQYDSQHQQSDTQQEQPTPKHDPVPVQVWKPCGMCGGSGTCYMCNGTGGYYFGPNAKWMECTACHGLKRCTYCAGQGGHYEVEYR